MKISILSEDSRDWRSVVSALKSFLDSEECLLFIGSDEDVIDIIPNLPNNFDADIDLIQFCNLKLFGKGELGIREIHWYTSEMLVRLPFLSGMLSAQFFKGRIRLLSYTSRYFRMLSRRFALDQISSGLSGLGVVIPHYVEPIHSATIVSRDFAKSLLELNTSGLLTYERAFFALARSSNYKCIRIAVSK